MIAIAQQQSNCSKSPFIHRRNRRQPVGRSFVNVRPPVRLSASIDCCCSINVWLFVCYCCLFSRNRWFASFSICLCHLIFFFSFFVFFFIFFSFLLLLSTFGIGKRALRSGVYWPIWWQWHRYNCRLTFISTNNRTTERAYDRKWQWRKSMYQCTTTTTTNKLTTTHRLVGCLLGSSRH